MAGEVKEPVAEGDGKEKEGDAANGEPDALAHGAGTGGARTCACVLCDEGAGVVNDVLQEGEHHKGHQSRRQGGLNAHDAITGEEDAVDKHHQCVARHREDEGPSHGEAFTIGGRAHSVGVLSDEKRDTERLGCRRVAGRGERRGARLEV